MRIGILTSRTAKEMVRETVSSAIGEIDIIDLPVHAISMLSAEALRKIVEKRPDIVERMRRCEVILVPGMVEGDVRSVGELVGRPVLKASRSLAHLPKIVLYLSSGGQLDTVKPAEEIMSLPEPQESFETAFRLGNLTVPRRGPPLLVASEIPASAGDAKATGARLAREGADIIVVGSSYEMTPQVLAERVESLIDLGLPVLAEAPSPSHAKAALDAGAHGVISNDVDQVAQFISNQAIVVGDRDWEHLASLIERLRELGMRKVFMDPVVGIPLLDFSKTAERYARALSAEFPLWFSASNAHEEIEADSHGVHAVLAALAVELRASVYSTVEGSWKSLHGTAEAREAIRVATRAFLSRTSERAFHSKLLIIKRSERPFRPPRELLSEAHAVKYVEPRLEKGFARIYVDHEGGEILVEFIGAGGRLALRGRHALSLARELVRRTGIGAEHAAYIGYELSKAELALRLGVPYVQDEPLLELPWDEK